MVTFVKMCVVLCPNKSPKLKMLMSVKQEMLHKFFFFILFTFSASNQSSCQRTGNWKLGASDSAQSRILTPHADSEDNEVEGNPLHCKPATLLHNYLNTEQEIKVCSFQMILQGQETETRRQEVVQHQRNTRWSFTTG